MINVDIFIKICDKNNMDITDMTADMSLHDNAKQKKRENYLEWQDYFMATAFLAAQRSKDPNFQVGACIVNKENKIVGVGYNGMPNGCSDDKFPWDKNTPSILDSKTLFVCHAEMNAILNKNSADVKDCSMYVGLFPCNECAKMIIQAGIKHVYYLSDEKGHKANFQASKIMFEAADVKYHQYTPKQRTIEIKFPINQDAMSNSK